MTDLTNEDPNAVNTHSARLIALYLPQFHPIPENDRWWGMGFTEWTNISRAQPLFRGHDQPRRPTDLGYYDLRVPEVRAAQAELAQQYGLAGFCYWHYWFEGQRLLERPFHEVLTSGEPNFPFCLAWANETWSRRWLGEERDVLMKQGYSRQDDVNHGRWLVQAFADPRYLRVGDRPLFMVYRPLDLPEPRWTTDAFRDACVKEGLPEPYLIGVDAHFSHNPTYKQMGFDSSLRFNPQLGFMPDALEDGFTLGKFHRNRKFGVLSPRLKLYDSREATHWMNCHPPLYPVHPCVYVGWDNSPRRGRNAVIILNNTPELFRERLEAGIALVAERPPEEQIVIVNAWNEWAEGNYLEPDATHGHDFLKALVEVRQARPSRRMAESVAHH